MSSGAFRADGRCALVTGGSRGIGAAIAAALAAAGARVLVNYAHNAEAAQRVVDAITAAGGRACAVQADVADADAVTRLWRDLPEGFGPADIVVNNAAVTRDGFAMLMPLAAWDEVIAVDLRGAFLCARQGLRHMIRQRWGRIVNVISPAALIGKDGAANYAAAKGGLLSLTKSLAREVGRYGITVNSVCPGLIATELLATMPAAERQRLQQQIALGRVGDPTEVANAVRFLSSSEAAYITGTNLTVDGGLTML